MRIKQFLIDLVPFFIVKRWIQRNDKKNSIIAYDPNLPDIEDHESKFKYIVSVQGLGYSGSGAVVDILREYSNCLTFGGIDEREGSGAKGLRLDSGEIDFLRFSGGLFEIEKYLEDDNIFFKDALIKRFKCTLDCCHIFKYPETRQLANQFYNKIIDFEIDTNGRPDINWQVTDRLRQDCNIKIMRNLTVSEYYNLCQIFLRRIFNCFYQDKFEYLCLDQLCSDGNYDTQHYYSYIPNLKIILVYRDPRDVYSFAIKRDIPWIAHANVNEFIKWYKIQTKNIKTDSQDYLVIRFEDLVNNCSSQISRIESYLGLKTSQHNSERRCFIPEKSRLNIGIWRTHLEKQSDFDVIYQDLREFCYE